MTSADSQRTRTRLLDTGVPVVIYADEWGGIGGTAGYVRMLAEGMVARGYRVVDTMPFGLKRLRAYLRERGVGRLTIKKRGTAVTPEQLRKQLALTGDGEATLVLTRVGGQQRVLVVEPLDRATAGEREG